MLAHYKADELMAENEDNANNQENEDKELYEKYTGVRVGTAFGLFMLLLFAQTVIAMIIKLVMNKEFQETSWGSKLQHACLIVNLPDNYGDFTSSAKKEEPKSSELGNVGEYRRRHKMLLLESCIMILLQFVSHIVMIVPFWVTGEVPYVYLSPKIKHHHCSQKRGYKAKGAGTSGDRRQDLLPGASRL